MSKGSKVSFKELAAARRHAADLEYKAAQESITEFRRQYTQTREDYKPWRDAGLYALDQITTGMRTGEFEMPDFVAPTMEQVEQTPGYQFRLQQGEKALMRQSRAMGISKSGAAAKALIEHGQGHASQEYGSAYDRAVLEYNLKRQRLHDRWGRYYALSGGGYNATGAISNMGYQTTGAAAHYRQVGAQALGQGEIGAAQAMIDQQMYNNQFAQQGFNNIMSVASLGGGLALGAYAAL